MNSLYPTQKVNDIFSPVLKTVLTILVFMAAFTTAVTAQTNVPELVFSNSTLVSGKDGKDGAVYRFPSVSNGIDALVKITGRSSSLVSQVDIDMTGTGHDKAFQPQVTYGNGNTSGAADWWLEYEISFVQSGTNTLVSVQDFNVTALDVDGDGDKMNEYVSFYNQKSYTLEGSSQLHVTSLLDMILSLLTPGKRFDGPVTNYKNIDTSATQVMVTNSYHNSNTFHLRTGGRTTGTTSVSDRMYSFWFKGFSYQAPVQSTLPATLVNWNATYADNNVALKWTTTVERNVSHFMIERSFDGADYTDAAMIVAVGNSDATNNYSFNDKIPAGNTGVIYYRLKVVDMDGRATRSDVRIIRIGKGTEQIKIVAYPNPVMNDVRVTVPSSWQDKAITYQVIGANGQTMKSFTIQHANQTEIVSLSQVPAGMYILKVTNGNEISTQTIVKTNN